MRTRVILTVLFTAIIWLGVSLLSLGGRHDGYWGNFTHHLGQAFRFDEELIAFSCFLLFSVAVAVHLIAMRWRASYRVRFLPAQLGALYAVAALILGSVLRQPLRQPWEVWFHVVFTLAAMAGFVALFGRRYFGFYDMNLTPNPAAPVNAPIAPRFLSGHGWRRVTEQQRSLTHP